MKFTILKKGLILVSVPLLFQLAFIGLVGRSQREHLQAVDADNHSKEVIRECETVMRALLDYQTGARGFILTAAPSFTEPLESGSKQLPGALDRLQFLVRANPQQNSDVHRIRAAVDRFMDWEDAVVLLVRQGARDDAIARVKTGMGKVRMDAVRHEIASFLAEEERSGKLRQERLKEAEERLTWLLIAGTALAILITFILVIAFSRGVSQRLSILTENSNRLSRREALNSPVRGSDEIAELDRSFRKMAAELSRSEETLRNQTQILESILTSMGDGVVVADREGRFLVFNPAAEQILGVGRTETRPEQWTERYGCYRTDTVTPYPVDDLPLVRAIRGESINAVEMYIRHARQPSGDWISVTGRPLKDLCGTLLGGVVVFRDITEAKRIEGKIRGLNEELEQRVRDRTAALEEANRDLAQKNQENEMFVYSVSHDLRSPLVNMQGFSKELVSVCDELRAVVAENNLPEPAKQRALKLLDGEILESIRFIHTAVRRLSGIIDALLRLSRAGRIEYQCQIVDVQGTVTRIVESMGSTTSQRGAAILVHDLPSAWGDPTALEQVLANLIGNALNYLDPCRTGQIEIGSLTQSDAADSITYYVKDNGVGIAESQYPKVFQALQRLHPEMADGEGMGLSMARRIVERHGGRIWFESTVGVGSTFFVTLQGRPTGRLQPAFKETSIKKRGYQDECTAADRLARGR